MYQEGEISISECTKCGKKFPVFTFIADNDMVTIGCVALTGPGNSIILTEHGPNESIEEIEARVGSNHQVVRVSFENESTKKVGSFQEFRESYQPGTPIYSCIYCGSNAKAVKHETKEQFLGHGKIEVLNGC